MTTLIAFLITIGLLVTVHEYGHFQVARWCGIRVLRFSIGFGKPIWKTTFGRDRTEFILAAIPLGGYVKMLDERELKQEALENAENTNAKTAYTEAELLHAFNRKSVFQRMAVVLAGPGANLLLAVLLYWCLFMLGITGDRPIVGDVEHNSLASQANMNKGDLILKVDGQPVKTWQEARWILLNQSFEKPSVEIETLNDAKEIHTHHLRFDGLNDDTEVDILEKLGMHTFRPKMPAQIGEILPNSIAEKVGFKAGDKIVAIDNVTISDWENVVSYVKESPNKNLQFSVERNQQIIKLNATPEATEVNGKTVGRLGASAKLDEKEIANLLINIQYKPFERIQKAMAKTWDTAVFSLKMLVNMVTGKVSWKGISGPASIAGFAGESAHLGLKVFLGFLALVSISIGVLNLLPIPVLDGGHLMYYIIEIIKGSPVSEQVVMAGQKIGFGILGLLMMVAIFNDINRFL